MKNTLSSQTHTFLSGVLEDTSHKDRRAVEQELSFLKDRQDYQQTVDEWMRFYTKSTKSLQKFLDKSSIIPEKNNIDTFKSIAQ